MRLFLATAVLFTACGFAQESQTTPQEPAPPAAQPQPAPAEEPAPIAPIDQPVEPTEAAPAEEYGGPAILSRGGGPSVSRATELARIRPFITLNGIYDSGLGTTSVNSEGKVPFGDGYGIESIVGVNGSRVWKRTSLDIDYRGSFRHYTQRSYFDGIDQSLQLGVRHQLSSRTSFSLTESAARYQRAYSMPLAGYYSTGFNSYDPSFSGLTSNDLFDTPTTALHSSAELTHQLSARLSVGIGAGGFIVRRRSAALLGTNGYQARSDIAYRLTRYQTMGVAYEFNHFDFSNQYGRSDMHSVTLDYSIRIGRYWELAVTGGASRVESNRLNRVQLPPEIARALGYQFLIEKFYSVAYLPRLGAHLTRTFRRSTASANYTRTVLAGNGIFATSGHESAALGYSYAGIRRLSLQVGISYSRLSSLTLNLGRYRNYSASAGFTYQLTRGFSLIGRTDGRRAYVSASELNRIYYRAQFGFAWHAGDYPLALW